MRIERLISMVMILLQKELVSTKELAAIFQVTPRTILRDVEALSLANIPVYTQRGRNGGVGLLPNYKVDKKLLTAQDISNLLTALSSVQQLITSPELSATITKIQAMEQEKSPESLSIQFSKWQGQTEIKKLAEKINQAVTQHRLIEFSYYDRLGVATQRIIEPYHLAYLSDRWYIEGFATKRQDFRTFRLSRMTNVVLLTETFTPRPFSSQILPPAHQSFQPIFFAITLQAQQLIRDILVERFGEAKMTAVNQDEFLIELTIPKSEASFRFLMSLGKRAKIIKSDPLFLTEFRQYLAAVSSLY
ncbi:helix-turn-helix transcriptional regulator [Enterococcus timonensis]|uniref:helix-turn-helix transcriptional regulator n=1 Tax=Enterococcus timonensis TaxID=1852364 RepID=UPI0008D8E333|nr:YafY family protein [Enterococcus timonensis]